MKLVPIVLALVFLIAGAPAHAADESACKPIPKGKRILKLNFKPDSALLDVVNLYSMLACKRMVVSGDVSKHRVTIAPQNELTLEEVRQLVLTHAEKAKVQIDETERTIEVRPR